MEFSETLKLIRLLPTSHERAITTKQLKDRWDESYGDNLNIRKAQRYLNALTANLIEQQAIVDIVGNERRPKYFLRLSEVAQWLMTQESALYHVMSLEVLQNNFGNNTILMGIDREIAAAEHLTNQRIRTQRLRQRIRIVPGGVQLKPKIQEQVVTNVIGALADLKRIKFKYKKPNHQISEVVVDPLGLISRDQTLYLIARGNKPNTAILYALHRMTESYISPDRITEDDFNIDEYINHSNDLVSSHLKLRVHKDTVYHFSERPFNDTQKLEIDPNDKDYYILEATKLPSIFYLKPFLASMGSGIEVLEPKEIRNELGKWLRDAAAYYD